MSLKLTLSYLEQSFFIVTWILEGLIDAYNSDFFCALSKNKRNVFINTTEFKTRPIQASRFVLLLIAVFDCQKSAKTPLRYDIGRRSEQVFYT
jgi:hypothetical protein